MSAVEGTVVVIDDDVSVREGLDSLLRSAGLAVRLYESVEAYGAADPAEGPTCLVLDVRLPRQGGLDFQRSVAGDGAAPPIVFITGHGDIAMSVRAMKAGAVEFLTKPFGDDELLGAVAAGLDVDRARRSQQSAMSELTGRYASLSEREREVMGLAVQGLMNKQIGGRLGIREITVKVHRGAAMRKIGARTFAELVIASERLKAAAVPRSRG